MYVFLRYSRAYSMSSSLQQSAVCTVPTVRVRLFGETILFIILLYLWSFVELNDVHAANEMN